MRLLSKQITLDMMTLYTTIRYFLLETYNEKESSLTNMSREVVRKINMHKGYTITWEIQTTGI